MLRVVRCRDVTGVYYSVRTEDETGTECEIARGSQAECEAVQDAIKKLGNGSPSFTILVAALFQIIPVSRLIEGANDQQGTLEYATKSHMRSWGAEIRRLSSSALAQVGVFEVVRSNIGGNEAGEGD